jgi:hypothetical protein
MLKHPSLDAPSLTLRASPSQGMHVHLARKRDQSKLDSGPDFVSTYESGSTKCYFNKVNSHLLHTSLTDFSPRFIRNGLI